MYVCICVYKEREYIYIYIYAYCFSYKLTPVNAISLVSLKDSTLGGTSFCQYLDGKSDTSLVKGGYSQGKLHISSCVCLKLIHFDTFSKKYSKTEMSNLGY